MLPWLLGIDGAASSSNPRLAGPAWQAAATPLVSNATGWALNLSHAAPWAAYPRPSLTRDDDQGWMLLNESWTFDGSARNLSSPPFGQTLPATIVLPFPAGSPLSTVPAAGPSMLVISSCAARRTVRGVPARARANADTQTTGIKYVATVFAPGRRIAPTPFRAPQLFLRQRHANRPRRVFRCDHGARRLEDEARREPRVFGVLPAR